MISSRLAGVAEHGCSASDRGQVQILGLTGTDPNLVSESVVNHRVTVVTVTQREHRRWTRSNQVHESTISIINLKAKRLVPMLASERNRELSKSEVRRSVMRLFGHMTPPTRQTQVDNFWLRPFVKPLCSTTEEQQNKQFSTSRTKTQAYSHRMLNVQVIVETGRKSNKHTHTQIRSGLYSQKKTSGQFLFLLWCFYDSGGFFWVCDWRHNQFQMQRQMKDKEQTHSAFTHHFTPDTRAATFLKKQLRVETARHSETWNVEGHTTI